MNEKGLNSLRVFIQAINEGKRLPELEPIIMQDTTWLYHYTIDVIKGRWPEAEPIISQDARYAYLYAREVIKGRWLEAEEIIAKTQHRKNYIEHFFDESVVTKEQVDTIQWERMNLLGYFAPASLFNKD